MRPEKKSIVAEIRAQVAGSSFVFLANHKGMSVAHTQELRKRLAKLKAQFHVVKLSYFKKAVEGLPGISVDPKLSLPLAIVFGQGDAVETAKALAGFAAENKVATIASGFLDGRSFTAPELAELIKLPPRSVLLGMLAGGLAAPLAGLAGVMRQKVSSIVYALQAIQDSKGKSVSK